MKGAEDLAALEEAYGVLAERVLPYGGRAILSGGFGAAEADKTLLRLRLTGRVTREILSSIGPFRARMAERLMHLELRTEISGKRSPGRQSTGSTLWDHSPTRCFRSLPRRANRRL